MRRVLALALFPASLATAVFADTGNRHVRSSDTELSRLLSRGAAASATFRTLVDTIDAVAVIVYVEPAVKLPAGRDGELLHVLAGSKAMPMLRVRIRNGLGDSRKIAVIAHELQHVVETIQGGGLTSAHAMTALFAALDRSQTRGGDPFDTDAAGQVEARVASELRTAAKAARRRHKSPQRNEERQSLERAR